MISFLIYFFVLHSSVLDRTDKFLFVSKDQTVWFELELLQDDILVKSNKFRKQQIFHYIKKNYYQNSLGATITILDDDKIQYYDPNHLLRFNLYREKTYEAVKPKFNNYEISPNTQQLEGTWYSKTSDKKLALLSTREGFKIKFSGTSNWVDFVYDKEKDTFVDSKGNIYTFYSLTEADWISYEGNKIRIEKISNIVEY